MYALTRPGRSSTGPFSVKIFRNRGPEIARSHPVPDCDLNSDNRQLSNAGLQRLTTSLTAAVSWLRSPASPSCGQLIEIAIRPYRYQFPLIHFKLGCSTLPGSGPSTGQLTREWLWHDYPCPLRWICRDEP